MENNQAESPASSQRIPHVSETAHRRKIRQVKKADPFRILMNITRQLDAAKITYTITRYRYDAISIRAVVPGERWEIDVLEDGDVDFERFTSTGEILERDALTEYIAKFADS